MVTKQVRLTINDAPIELDHFVRGYIEHVVGGILSSLRGTEEIAGVDLSIAGDQVSIVLNDAAVPLNPFATRIIRNTLVGVVSSLRGVRGVRAIERMQVSIKR